jgi:hypothetical protein
MLLIMNPIQFKGEHVVLNEPVKNQIFNDSTFTRIVYSNNVITINGIVLKLELTPLLFENKHSGSFSRNTDNACLVSVKNDCAVRILQHSKNTSVDKRFNRANIHFNVFNNRELIEIMRTIEHQLLSAIQNKTPVYGLYNELSSGRIVVHDYNDIIVIKISGIWETELNCGITYKFASI